MKICRICMQGDEDRPLQSIFSEVDRVHLAETVAASCSLVLAAEDDGLPGQICAPCVRDVQQVATFRERARESDRKLRQVGASGGGDFEVVVVKTESIGEDDDDREGFNLAQSESDSEDDRPLKRRRRAKTSSSDEEEFTVIKVKRKSKQVESDSEDELDVKTLSMFEEVTLPESSYVCCSCYKHFDSVAALELHVEIHKRHVVKRTDCIYCEICKRKFKKESALNRHVAKVSALTKLYECVQCNVRFMNAAGRRMHAQRHPQKIEEKMKQEFGEIFCCVQNCSKSFTSEQLLIEHGHEAHRINKQAYELEDSTLKPIECPVCFKKFASEQLLRRHRRRNSQPLNHQCATCGLKFRTKDVLSFHELNHSEKKPFPCEICQKHFSSKNSLKVHQRSHSNDKPFICSTCGARFYQKAQLVTHEYTHQDGPLPFRCETCSKYCKTKNALRNHMRQHTGEKPYPCRHCSISFSNHTNRQRHEMNHTGNKPFACSFCDRKFTINRLKLEHECKHTGVKPFKCSFCEKSFIRKRFQLDHEATHTGEKPYRCELPSCNRTFSQQAPLRRHMVTHRTEGSAEFFPLNQQTPNVSILPSSSSV
ncbi:hypothetical protein quinque_011646 [Culex quinquefasciatus]|uniref:oocyte zinc finger protein XlCOF6 n=1 Tax=Culex quinquefasciatus TaxID=7176 RepID=UPI0018E3C1B8|nr:oocyte zinc finger protein XlCOF6 [Culex quinquefasciatus]